MNRFNLFFTVFISLTLTLVLGQACGKFESVSIEASENGDEVNKSAAKITLDPASLLTKESPIRVYNEISDYPAGTQILWDHQFGNGLTYCEQTTSLNRTSTVFVCPSTGTLKVFLVVITPLGEEQVTSIELQISDQITAPTPTPPPQISGSGLYNQYCSGCHGPLASSTKRGTSISALNNAISSVSTMRGLSSLTSAERQAIVDALR